MFLVSPGKVTRGNAHGMIKALVPSPLQIIYTHTLHPLLRSTALRIPACNNSMIAVPLVTKNLTNFVSHMLSLLASPSHLLWHRVRGSHGAHGAAELWVFWKLLKERKDVLLKE
jgi:hypothetical protein